MKSRSIRISLAVTALSAACCFAVKADDYSDKIQFADGLYTRQMYELAAREYASMIKKYPDGAKNDVVAFRLAECLRLMGKTKESARLYSSIVYQYKSSPFRLRAAYRRARLYMQEEDYTSAIAHFEVILNEKPPADLAAATTFYLGEAQLKSDQTEKADKTFARIISQYPNTMFYAHALMYRGEIYRDKWLKVTEKGKTDDKLAEKALGFFKKALAAKSGKRVSAEALFQMAEIRFRQKRFDLSSEYYHKLMLQYPDDERATAARMQASWSAANAGLHAEALSLADKALADTAADGNRDEWLYLKANAQRQLLQNRDAIITYLALLNKYPESRFIVPARYEIAVTYFKMGKYQDAIQHAEQIRITPELRSDVCWLLAESYAALKKDAEAIQYYRMVIRDNPKSERARDALYRLAYHLQNQQAYREASQTYNKLVAQFPKSKLAPQALYASAFSLEKANAYEDAVRDWRRLTSDYPNSKFIREAIYQKAMCEIRLERKEAAITSLNEFLRRFPAGRFSADAHYWNGMLAYELQQYPAAESALREAMQKSSREELKNDAAFQLGLTLQKLKRSDEAAAIFRKLMDSPASSKFSPELLEWLATWYNTHNESDKSEEAAVLLIKSTKEPAWKQAGWVLLGRARDKLGKKKDARLAYKHAIEIGVNTHYASEAALWLGNICLDATKGADAAKYFNIAMAKSVPQNKLAVRANATFGLGRAAEIGKNYDAAARYFMSIAILYDDPKLVPECLYRAALSYDKLKRASDRNKAAQELLQRYPQSAWAGKVKKSWLQ